VLVIRLRRGIQSFVFAERRGQLEAALEGLVARIVEIILHQEMVADSNWLWEGEGKSFLVLEPLQRSSVGVLRSHSRATSVNRRDSSEYHLHSQDRLRETGSHYRLSVAGTRWSLCS
jgi:hypothetical protein